MEVHSWRVIRTPLNKLHLLTLWNLSAESGTVRVSSTIAAVDSDACVVTTSSGRRYELMCPPETREFERDVLQRGAVKLGMGDAVDVSVFAWDQLSID
ncbi:hypothetical protein [Pelomonas sp. Root1237]|uniref:hypothetical protein n=1 Tax=Pelomonas sp. Root1237 TaxID=1736434 RepID=UPI000700140D|nr:hypothetical protein [Pelomonas sp. Root1237]